MTLTVDGLRELLHYDPKTGVFIWKKAVGRRAPVGKIAGWVEKGRGRRTIEIGGKNYKAHRLAWLYVHGCWPHGVIDHKNGNADDNSIANLRDTSQRVNTENRRHGLGVSGLIGAHWCGRDKNWCSSIRVQGVARSLGHGFDTPEAAHQAYLQAKRRLHEGCTI